MLDVRPFIALACVSFGALLLAGCGGSGADGNQPATPTRVAVESPTEEPASACLASEGAPVAAACGALRTLLRVPASAIELVSSTGQQWSDSCLGLPRSGEACAEVITPGFEVVLKHRPTPAAYTFRTDEASNARLASIDLPAVEHARASVGEAVPVVAASEPVAFDFAPDGRLFYTERQAGEIRVVDPASGSESSTLFAQVETFVGSECGLLGIAIDPEFASNHYLYVYVTQPVEGRTAVGKPRLIRYREEDGRGLEPAVIIDNLPLTKADTCAHLGGNIHFGPDGYLYLSLGNFERPSSAADLSIATGKILRVRKEDGAAAPDNPLASRGGADKRIFAYGLRNPWDFAFDPQTASIFAADNGPGNCDEVDLIVPGGDYGVPRSLPSSEVASCLGLGGIDPVYLFAAAGMQPSEFGSNVAPAGLAFLSGGRYAGLGEGILVCQFVTQELHLLELSGPDGNQIARDVDLGQRCGFNVEARDGMAYFSNSSGIFRLEPASP